MYLQIEWFAQRQGVRNGVRNVSGVSDGRVHCLGVSQTSSILEHSRESSWCQLQTVYHTSRAPYNNIANSLFSLSSTISALLRSFVPVLSCVCVCVFYSVFISIKATITSMFTTHQLQIISVLHGLTFVYIHNM